MKTKVLYLSLALFCFMSQAQQQGALTQQQVVQLLQLKTPEQEIIEKVKAGGTTFTLGTEDIARLKRAGATAALLSAMQGGAGGGADLTTAEISDLCLVVDYSGSMSGKTTDGSTKIAAAKQAVAKLIDNIPPDINVAVVVYGCDKGRGCEDIDLVQPLGPIDRAALKSKLLGLPNTGMTPIAGSLEIAGLALQKAKGGRAIILVTDGVESCKGDPSKVAAQLAAEFGVKFGLHVVGFDINANERASLESIASNGHGKYYNAKSAAELAAAMQKVTEQVSTAPKDRGTVKYEASGQNVKGGLWFDDAPVVQPGEYAGSLRFKEAFFYAVPVQKGQEVRAIATIMKGELVSRATIEPPTDQEFVVTIYSPSLDVVAREEVKTKGNSATPFTPRATWTAEIDGVAYVCVGATANHDNWRRDEGKLDKPPQPSAFSLKIRTEGEAGTVTRPQVHDVKPGNNPATAGSIPGSGMVVGDIKFGESAYFSVAVTKGDLLQASIAAQKPFQKRVGMIDQGETTTHYKLLVYDDDQVEVAKKDFKMKGNPPDPGAASITWPVTLSGKATIVVALEENTKLPSGPARLAVLVKKPGSEDAASSGEGSDGQSSKPKGKDAFSGAEGKNK